MYKFLFKPLGMDAYKASTPYIAPLVAAGITAASGLASSLIGSSTQKSSNESYLKGVRETNQANKELYQLQVNDNRVNWAMENAYNTPAQQLARLRQAGINGSSVDGSPFGSIQSSSAPAQVAPEQTPNPYGNLNLGGITVDAIQAYKSGQQIEDSKYNLYQHGIESLFFYRNQLNKARSMELELLSKENKNDYDYELLKQARIESKYYENRLQKQLRELDDNHDNLVKTGHRIDAETDEIQKRVFRDDKLALAQMKHWSKQDMISYYEAVTGRRLSYIQEKHVDSLVRQVNNNILQDWQKVRQGWHDIHIKQELNAIKRSYYALDEPERLLTRRLLQQEILTNASQYQFMLEKASAPLNEFFRNVLGIDTGDVLKAAGAAGAAYVGARTPRMK